ncbi:MAG: hypothetical protein LBK61_04590 [Spirochaetaceae bacterium]|jgi:hypothetical protein|nr:hypothetical protein [Spirochaetaceae bacterium]
MKNQNVLSEMIENAMGMTMEEWMEKCRELEDTVRRVGQELYLYKTISDEVADTRGIKKDCFILWYESDTAVFQIILSRVSQNDSTRYFIINDLEYTSRDANGDTVRGTNIMGIDTLMLRIDSGQDITLKDNSPVKRDIPVGPNSVVLTYETATFTVPAAVIQQLNACNKLWIQLRNDHRLVEIPKEGIEKLHSFLTDGNC